MWCLIMAESAIFSIFVVAYLYYAGKSISGPTPAQVLDVPVHLDLPVLQQRDDPAGRESAAPWEHQDFRHVLVPDHRAGRHLPDRNGEGMVSPDLSDGLTISTNLFGTTFYSLVGLHAFHVIVGATGLTIILIVPCLAGEARACGRVSVFAMYWHFVDAIWVVVLSVVYFITR